MTTVDTILSALQKVSKRGPQQWIACCPAHDDRGPSLSVRECADGTILLHCFAGCSPDAVLGAVGMRIGDLFPEKIAHHVPKKRLGVSAFDALRAMRHEILVLELLAADFAKGQNTPELRARAQLCADRINTVLDVCDGG